MIGTVDIPEGSRGPWTVKRFVVNQNESAASALRGAFTGRGYVSPGTYTQLVHARRGVVMSDTPDEQRDHYMAVRNADGHVLINGLGIGMVLAAVLKKPEVRRVTVVEIDPDVVALVGPAYATDQRVEIVTSSAFDYEPPKGVRYGAVWHDIWDTICGDNLPEMTTLKRKYGRRTDWQGCWGEDICRRHQARFKQRWGY
jgi:hypothetical protein